MTTPLNTQQALDHLFLLTLLTGRKADGGKLFNQVMTTLDGQSEKTYHVEVRVNGIELDFNDFTDKVNEQLEELIMNAARKLLDAQFADRFREISSHIYDAEQQAKNLRNALEATAREAWGMPPRQGEDD